MPNLRRIIAEANPHLPPEEITRLSKNQREQIYKDARQAAWRELEHMYPIDFALLYAMERTKRGIRKRTPPGAPPEPPPPLCEACEAKARAYHEAHRITPRMVMLMEDEPEPEPEPEAKVIPLKAEPAWVPDDPDPMAKPRQ